MNKIERIQAALAGREVDRLPYSFWSHLPGIDLDPLKLADYTYNFYKALDLDFIKTMANGMFAIEDFGCECDYSEVLTGGVSKLQSTIIEGPEDWDKIKPVDVTKGAYGRELSSIRFLMEKLKGEQVPVIVTEFSPLTTACKMSRGKVLEHLRVCPDKVKKALEVIARTAIKHANEAIKLGCSGIFFASQVSSFDQSTEEVYKEFGVPYDRMVLQGLSKQAWFNVVHIHGNNIMFELVKDYPVQGMSFHVWETNPSPVKFMKDAPNICIVGGIERMSITQDNRLALLKDIAAMKEITKKRHLIMAPGCVIRYPFNHDTIQACIQEIIK